MTVIEKAMVFAKDRHKEQKRKYSGLPYFVHLAEVASLVSMALPNDENAIAAAYLHDVVEDTEVTINEVVKLFGKDIGELVSQLTDVSSPSDGNRAKRKEIDRKHYEFASPRAQTIKLADLISNSRSIIKEDPEFAKIYMEEKKLLLPYLKDGNKVLYELAEKFVFQK